MENPGVHKKVEYRFTTTNLALCNDEIIVLKITLLHGVSVITNFVVPKRDKQSKKETSHFLSTAGERPRSCICADNFDAKNPDDN